MPSFTTSVTVDRPVDEVFDKFMSVDNMGKWLTGFKSIERIGGEPGTVGSKHRMVFEEQGREIEMIERVTTIRKNEAYSFDMEMNMMKGRVAVTFLPRGGKTEIRSQNELEGKKLFWRVMLPFMKSEMAKRQTTDYVKLKDFIESTSG